MTSFAAQIKAFADKTKEELDDTVALTVVKMAESVIKRSPVGNPSLWKSEAPKGYVGGHFRANWQLGIGEPAVGLVAGVDRSGEQTLGKIAMEIPPDAAGRIYYICNNLPYARRLEYGHSTQAPQGMVGLTITQFQGVVSSAVSEAKKK